MGTPQPSVRPAEATPEGATNAWITTKDTKSDRRHVESRKHRASEEVIRQAILRAGSRFDLTL